MLIQEGLSSPVKVQLYLHIRSSVSNKIVESKSFSTTSWIYHLGNHWMLKKTRFFTLFYSPSQDDGIHVHVSNQSC